MNNESKEIMSEKIPTNELAQIAGEAAKGRKTLAIASAALEQSEADRSCKLREENLAFRNQVERLSLALLNAESIHKTFEYIEGKFDAQEERFHKLEGLIGNLESELKNQKMIQVKALQMAYGHGPTA